MGVPQAFNEEDSEALLREWHKGDSLQPIPPETPEGFLKVPSHRTPPPCAATAHRR